jgi:hypothetical protein
MIISHKFNSAIKDNWLIICLYVIALLIIIITLFDGGVGGKTQTMLLFFIGLIVLFIAFLNPWGEMNPKYYAILIGISVLLAILPKFMPEKYDLVKIQAKMQLPGHWAEDMAWSIGFILVAGFMAGIIGLFISLGRKK